MKVSIYGKLKVLLSVGFFFWYGVGTTARGLKDREISFGQGIQFKSSPMSTHLKVFIMKSVFTLVIHSTDHSEPQRTSVTAHQDPYKNIKITLTWLKIK